MNTDKHPFENSIKAYIIHNRGRYLGTNLIDEETHLAFNSLYDISLPVNRKEQLLLSLNKSLSEVSLGIVIQKSLSGSSIPANELQEKTGLSLSLLQNIQEDLIFPNSIPIKSLVRLLTFLKIPLEKAIQALEITYQKLYREKEMLRYVEKMQPIFRQSSFSKNVGYPIIDANADSNYLFQNKESLDKYIKRLKELYKEG